MKKIKYVLFTFLTIFLFSYSVEASNSYDYLITSDVNNTYYKTSVSVSCNVNSKSFSLNTDSKNKLSLFHFEGNVIKDNYARITLEKPITVGNNKVSSVYAVVLSNKELVYIDTYIVDHLINNNNCLDISFFSSVELNKDQKIKDYFQHIQNLDSKVKKDIGIIAYKSRLLGTERQLVSSYAVQCNDSPIGETINLFEDKDGFYLEHNGVKLSEKEKESEFCGYKINNYVKSYIKVENNDLINIINKDIHYNITMDTTGGNNNTKTIHKLILNTQKGSIAKADKGLNNFKFKCTYGNEFSVSVLNNDQLYVDKINVNLPYLNSTYYPTLKKIMSQNICPGMVYVCPINSKSNQYIVVDQNDYINSEELHRYKLKLTGDLKEIDYCIRYDLTDGVSPMNYYYGMLINPIKAVDASYLNQNVLIDGKNVNLSAVTSNDAICDSSSCLNDPTTYLDQAINNGLNYCNSDYLTDKTAGDCIRYRDFVSNLVNNNIISIAEYTGDCGVVSSDLQKKLVWILDIIKIAGPIIALGLGTLDFIKAVASPDADKEMKTAWKHFVIRIVAAILLFIIPIILAFMMDIFLGNKDGYNSDNPYCGLIDWNK